MSDPIASGYRGRPAAAPAPGNAASLAAKLGPRLLLLVILGYPVVGTYTSFLYLEDRSIAIAFRGLLFAYALGVVAFALIRLPHRTLRGPYPAILLFFLIYGLRLFVDSQSGLFPDVGEAILLFVGGVVTPVAAVSLISRYHRPIDPAPFFVVGGILCVTLLIMNALGITGFFSEAEEFAGRLGLARLNPISIGHVCVTTLIAAFAVYSGRSSLGWFRWLLLPACGVALICLYLTGSRGPAVSLAAIILAVLIVQRRWFLLSLVSVAFILVIFYLSGSVGDAPLERFLAVGADETSRIRLELQGLAWDQFLAHPLTGSGYLEILTKTYPHNIFIDAAMSTGIVGLLLMAAIFILACIAAGRKMRGGELFVPLLFIQYAVAVQFSGTVRDAEIWICAALLLSGGLRASQGVASRSASPIPYRRGVAAGDV